MGRLATIRRQQQKNENRKAGKGKKAQSFSRMKTVRKDPGIPQLDVLKDRVAGRSIVGRAIAAQQQSWTALTHNMMASSIDGQTQGGAESAAPEDALQTLGAVGAADLRQYVQQLYQVIEEADVVIECLDARDPEACRSRQLEQRVVGRGKRLVLMLNKIDLVPPEYASGWLSVFQREFPCLPFKAATRVDQRQGEATIHRTNASLSDAHSVSTHTAVGPDALLNLMKNYARGGGVITVGVVGLPNTGKSSIINSLCRRKVANTAPQAGCTRDLQRIQVDKGLYIIDSPGVVLSAQLSPYQKVLLNVTQDGAVNVGAACDELVKRVPISHLCEALGIDAFTVSDTREFLLNVARIKHMRKNQGIWDLENAAKYVLRQLQAGRISVCVPPPMTEAMAPVETVFAPSAVESDVKLVSDVGQALDIDRLIAERRT